MLYIWFLFHMMNKQLPFTIGLPLTPKTYALSYFLNQIQQSLAKEKKACPSLLRTYLYSKKNIEETIPKILTIFKDVKPYSSPE